MRRRHAWLAVTAVGTVTWGAAMLPAAEPPSAPVAEEAGLRAGAARVEITPRTLPVLVNGGMLTRSIDRVKSPLHARAIALASGTARLALVIVDSCMLPRELCDEVKAAAATRCGIPAARIVIAATHTHSAPAAMGCLGTEADPAYVSFLRERLVEAVAQASATLVPARIGFGRIDAAGFTALRQWIRRPDRLGEDPFGNRTVRANMHAATNPDDVTGEAGPEDPELAVISLQHRDGRPLAALATFSMHYFGDQEISADYFGLFCTALEQRLGGGVAALAHGCSGDIWRVDYAVPKADRPDPTIDDYSNRLADLAARAVAGIPHRSDVGIAMAERRLALAYRLPDRQRLEWAERIVTAMGDRPPRDTTEVYAREQILLDRLRSTEVVVQALRVGPIAIATTPCETYALTGLRLEAASPLPDTMVIELANGGDGYIPPPEQHPLGGYNTWAARSAGLETAAEPKIAAAALELLEQVCGQPRRPDGLPAGPLLEATLGLGPWACWRLDEFTGPHAADASGHGRDAVYEAGITHALAGPLGPAFCGPQATPRAACTAGGRIRARLGGIGHEWSVSAWIWNGMPDGARPLAGWAISRGPDHGLGPDGDHLGLSGDGVHAGRLVFLHGAGPEPTAVGSGTIPRWTWAHVVLVRSGDRVRVWLDGRLDIDVACPTGRAAHPPLFIGGRSDNDSNWEGRIDEVTVFDRALDEAAVARLRPSAPTTP
jgi:hypothetical protein